jgi:4-oxalocrotonate tautomerase
MPLVQVSLAAGRSESQIRTLIAELTDATVRALDADPERVTVIVTQVDPAQWARGGATLAERAAAESQS